MESGESATPIQVDKKRKANSPLENKSKIPTYIAPKLSFSTPTKITMAVPPDIDYEKMAKILKDLMIDDLTKSVSDTIKIELKETIDTSIQEAINGVRMEFDDKLNSMDHQNKQLKMQVKALENKVTQLEEGLDAQEQYSRRNIIRVSGIKLKEDGEDDPLQEIIDLADTGGFTLDPNLHIDRVHRIGKKNDIIAKFTTYGIKQLFLDKKKDIHAAKENVFIAEDLTLKRSEILYEARKLKRAGKLKHVFTSNGNIVVRNPKDKKKKIFNTEDLFAFVNTD